jgi:alkylated DNA repair dioxygenase AlkB
VSAQLSLLGREPPSFDPGMPGLVRTQLDEVSWIDRAPDWIAGQAVLFDELREAFAWHAGNRRMYERRVDVPRLMAGVPEDGDHPLIAPIAAAVARHYDTELDAISLAWYRDGRDSVAWHRDRPIHALDDAIVATVSVGGPRPFLVRPFGGGPSRSFSVGWGDLVVMGGACQRHYEHCIPKVAHANGRICIMLRSLSERGRAMLGHTGRA